MPAAARRAIADEGLPFRDGLHAAGHAVLNVLPLFLMCAHGDMATECDNPYDSRYRPERILVYDTHPGGIGLAGQVRCCFGGLTWVLVLCPVTLDGGTCAVLIPAFELKSKLVLCPRLHMSVKHGPLQRFKR